MLKFSTSNHRSVGRTIHKLEFTEPTTLACAECGKDFTQFRKRPLPCCPSCEASVLSAWERNYVAPLPPKAHGAPAPRTKSVYARLIPKKPSATKTTPPKAPVASPVDPAAQLRDLLAAQKALETLLAASQTDERLGG